MVLLRPATYPSTVPLTAQLSVSGSLAHFTPITLSARDVGLQLTQLGVSPVSPSPYPSYGGNVSLGLYQQTPGTSGSSATYTRLAQTGNIVVPMLDYMQGSSYNLPFYAALKAPYTIRSAGQYLVGLFGDFNTLISVGSPAGGSVALVGYSPYTAGGDLASTVGPLYGDTGFGGILVLCAAATTGDPLIAGFHGQSFEVSGHAGGVYNLLSLPTLQVNTRFVQLNRGDSMEGWQMEALRAAAANTSSPLPSTWPWMHNGTYQGEVGISTRSVRVKVVAGGYGDGFASVTINRMPLVVSDTVHTSLVKVLTITRPNKSPAAGCPRQRPLHRHQRGLCSSTSTTRG